MTEKSAIEGLEFETILQVVPHRYPFLMLDRITEFESGKRGVGLKNVTVNEPHFLGHFPDNPVMPGVLLLEALAQLGGVVVTGKDGPVRRIGFLAGINGAKFRKMVRPGDQLRLEVNVISARKTLGKVKGVATVDGEVACEAEILFVFDS